MNANDYDNEKKLDEYIDALNAGRPLPQLDDAELVHLFATACDVRRLRAAEPLLDEVPTHLAVALERELRTNPAHESRNVRSHDMRLLGGASSNSALLPSNDAGTTYAESRRPERARQWAQFVVAAVAFIVVGVVLAQIIGGKGGDEPEGAVGSDPSGSPTTQASPTDSGASLLPDDVTTATQSPAPGATESLQAPTSTLGTTTVPVSTPVGSPSEGSSGLVTVDTFDEARELAQFEIVEPGTIPQQLVLERITVYTAPDQTSPEAIAAYYRHDGSDEVQFWQTVGGCIEPDFIEGTHEEIVIVGRAILRSIGTNESGESTGSYRWVSGDTCYTVRATLQNGVNEELLESLVSSIPLPAAGAESIGTPFPTLSVSPDYVSCEDEVIARGMNFTPGTTVVIYGGALFGDNFGPVTDDIPVADNGGFEFVLDLSRIFAQCGGADVQQEGAQFMLSAETGSTLTKGGFDGPSAQAVITFSSMAPAALKDRPRLPSCGIEVIRTETEMAPQGEPNVQARECFATAVEAGSAAEFISYVQTIDFEVQTAISWMIEPDTVVVYSNAERGRWEQYTCTGMNLPDQYSYQFQFDTCGGSVAIE